MSEGFREEHEDGYMPYGLQPLHFLCGIGERPDTRRPVETARLLLAHGADVHARVEDDNNRTPLHYAAASGSAELVHLLLESGAGMEAQTDDGRTALTMATSADVVACLIDAGADVPVDFNSADPQIQHLINEERERYQRVKRVGEIGLPRGVDEVAAPEGSVLALLIERVTPLFHSSTMTPGLFEIRLLNHALDIPELWRIVREQRAEAALILSELEHNHWVIDDAATLLDHLRHSPLRNPMDTFRKHLSADEMEVDLQRMRKPMGGVLGSM
jgi:hypothetical protein